MSLDNLGLQFGKKLGYVYLMSMKRVVRRWLAPILILPVLLGSILFATDKSAAQVPFQWTTPKQIPEYNDLLKPPQMIGDQNRTVHAFNMEAPEDGGFAIMYRSWTMERGWSSPVDVILPVYMGVAPSLLDVTLDGDGNFHLIFFGGTQQENAIYYTKVLAIDAENSSRWLKPVTVSDEAGPLASAQILRTDSGVLTILFAGSRYGSGLYETHLEPETASWSTPTLIHRSNDEDLNPGGIRLAKDGEGRLHIVWHMDDVSGLAKETWYVRMESDLESLSHMAKLSQSDDESEFNGQPSILLSGDELFVIYYDGFPPTRFVRRSRNYGETWSSPVRPFPHRGGYGHASLVQDSLGTLHLLVGNRLQNPEIHGMWYSRFVDHAWLPLQPIVSGPATATFDPTRPEAVVVQGNLLLVAWSNDVRQEYRSPAWYSYTLLDAPLLPTATISTVSSEATQVVESDRPVVAQDVESNSDVVNAQDSSSNRSTGLLSLANNPAVLIFLGVAPVVILVTAVFVRRLGQA